jgi:hypothetical protein
MIPSWFFLSLFSGDLHDARAAPVRGAVSSAHYQKHDVKTMICCGFSPILHAG